MNCCDEYCASHGCNQGRECPVRTGKPVRKVRAGGPPPTELPPLPIDVAKPDREPGDTIDRILTWTLIAALAFIVTVAITGGW